MKFPDNTIFLVYIPYDDTTNRTIIPELINANNKLIDKNVIIKITNSLLEFFNKEIMFLILKEDNHFIIKIISYIDKSEITELVNQLESLKRRYKIRYNFKKLKENYDFEEIGIEIKI